MHDEAFAGAPGPRPKRRISLAHLLTLTVLQFTENLANRKAVEAARPNSMIANSPCNRSRQGPRYRNLASFRSLF